MNEKKVVRLVASFLHAKAEEEKAEQPNPGDKDWQREMTRFTEDDFDLPVPSKNSQFDYTINRGGTIR